MEERKIFGMTGNLGSGKSTLSLYLQKLWEWDGKHLSIIEIDTIRRYALWTSCLSHHIQLRRDLGQIFNLATIGKNHWIERDEFTNLIFSSMDSLNLYRSIANPVFFFDVNQHLNRTSADCIIVWTYLLEEKYHQFINSMITISYVSTQTWSQRFISDHLAFSEVQKRINFEPTIEERINLCNIDQLDYELFNNDQASSQNIFYKKMKQLKQTMQHNQKFI